MNILMMTNTYAPHVGGVARSVQSFAGEFRRRGHRVVVVAPPYDGPPSAERDVLRVPAVKHFHGGDFSFPLPAPGFLTAALEGFHPDVVHAHHPFLLGDTALVLARVHGVPLVFTHHTMYEHYTHNAPGDSPAARRFIARFAAGFANRADRVFAPSRSVADVLKAREVRTDIEVVPTGIDLAAWRAGDGNRFRQEQGIPPGAPVAGHLGRLSEEKNLDFLARAAALFLRRRPDARFVLLGEGPKAADVEAAFRARGTEGRLLRRDGKDLRANADALSALDVFAFSSVSETQGLVLAEAMACGAPVVALDGPGVRDVVEDGKNGRLLPAASEESVFADALEEAVGNPPELRAARRRAARETAAGLSLEKSADRALAAYRDLAARRVPEPMAWEAAARWAAAEWQVLVNFAEAAKEALRNPCPGTPR